MSTCLLLNSETLLILNLLLIADLINTYFFLNFQQHELNKVSIWLLAKLLFDDSAMLYTKTVFQLLWLVVVYHVCYELWSRDLKQKTYIATWLFNINFSSHTWVIIHWMFEYGFRKKIHTVVYYAGCCIWTLQKKCIGYIWILKQLEPSYYLMGGMGLPNISWCGEKCSSSTLYTLYKNWNLPVRWLILLEIFRRNSNCKLSWVFPPFKL